MKPFLCFYDPKSMDQPFSINQIEKIEASIYKDVEIAIKSVRSSRNLNTKMRKNQITTKILKNYLDFIED
jgi:hypothetical protein